MTAEPDRETSSGYGSETAEVLEEAADSTGLDVLARSGFAVLALLHILIGAIAAGIAFGGYGQAETSGAIGPLARSEPFGPLLMWAGCISCAALALWQLAEATVRVRRAPLKKRLGKGVSSGSLVLIYGSVAATFAAFAAGRGRDSGDSTADFSAAVIDSPAGSPALGAVGALVLGIGGYFVFKGCARRFRPELRYFAHTRRGHLLNALGVAGHVGKGIALVLVGMLFIAAAINHRAEESTGLDGSLQALLDYSFGAPLILAIAAGLICYGIFALARARWGRM
ncbi:DUF1206 domain-containing protein [Arthrobacter koreensis]|uniref:DUF1206 domain-containing protein n=1 Tax=Arthrobacter koreensis TaxID=199136 RepID=UPI0036D95022